MLLADNSCTSSHGLGTFRDEEPLVSPLVVATLGNPDFAFPKILRIGNSTGQPVSLSLDIYRNPPVIQDMATMDQLVQRIWVPNACNLAGCYTIELSSYHMSAPQRLASLSSDAPAALRRI